MLHLKTFPNRSRCCSLPRGKVFDPVTKQLIEEPLVIIDPKIDYRSLSIEVQLENGTLGDKVDMSDFGTSRMDMSDRISKVASEINETLDKVDKEEKRWKDIEKVIEETFNN